MAAACVLIKPVQCHAQNASAEARRDGCTVKPTALLQLDTGRSFASGTGEVSGVGANFRRARFGLTGNLPSDFAYTLEWDFGGRPGRQSRIYEASMAWTGLDGVTVRAGAFEPNFSLQLDRSAQALLFLERSAVVDVAKQITTDTARMAVQARANGDRWFVSVALTGGQAGPGYDGSERARPCARRALPYGRVS